METSEQVFEAIGEDTTGGAWRSMRIAETMKHAAGLDRPWPPLHVRRDARRFRSIPSAVVPLHVRHAFGSDGWLASDDGHVWRFELVAGLAPPSAAYHAAKLAMGVSFKPDGALAALMFAGVDRITGFAHVAMLTPRAGGWYCLAGAGSFDPMRSGAWTRPASLLLQTLLERGLKGEPLPGDALRRVRHLVEQINHARRKPVVDPTRVVECQ